MKNSALKSAVCVAFTACAFVLFAGPEQDFDAAVKAGKPLTAEAAYLKLVKSGAKVAPIRHYQAAQVADQLGKQTLQKDRLMLFARLEKGWKPEVEQTLWRLVRMYADVEYYERLSANLPASRVLWRAGYDMLVHRHQANRPAEVLRLADILLSKFREADRQGSVLNILAQSTQATGSNYPERDLVDMLMRHPGLGQNGDLRWMIRQGQHAGAFRPDFVLRYAQKHGDAADDILEPQLSALDSDAQVKLAESDKVAERDERLATVRKLRKLCFDGKHPASAVAYFRLAAIRYPKQFWKTVETNGYAAGACAMFKELTAFKDYAESGDYRYRVNVNCRNQAIAAGRFSRAETAQLVDAAPESFDLSQLLTLSSLGDVRAQVGQQKSMAPIAKLAQKFPKRADEIYRGCYRDYVSGPGSAADIRRIFLDIARHNGDISWQCVDWLFGGAGSMSIVDKVALCKDAYAITGYTGAWADLVKSVGRAKNGYYADPAVKAFAATLKPGTPAADPLVRVVRAAEAAKKLAEVQALVADFRKAYPSKYGEAKNPRDNSFANRFLQRYCQLAGGGAEDNHKLAELLIEKRSKSGPDNGWIWNAINRAKDGKLWLDLARANAQATGSHDAFRDITAAKDSDKPVEGVDFKKMTPGAADNYLANNLRVLKRPAAEALFFDWLNARPLAQHTVSGVNTMMRQSCDWALLDNQPNEGFFKRFPLAAVEDLVFADPYGPYDRERVFDLLRGQFRVGKLEPAVKRYCAWAAKMEPRDRYAALEQLLMASIWIPPKEKGQNGWNTSLVNDELAGQLLVSDLLPALAAVPVQQAALLAFTEGDVRRLGAIGDAAGKAKDEARQKAVREFGRLVVRDMLAGASNQMGGWGSGLWYDRLDEAFEAKDSARLGALARPAAVNHWSYPCDGRARKTFANFGTAGNDEAFYLYVNAMPSGASPDLVAEAAKHRAALATVLPGIYPVGENDPSYPLYVAADELKKKNPERAWQILKDPRNQTVFEREALKLPPDFVIWGVDQLRMSRGDKDALLLKARQIATAIIAQEGKVAPEVVAAMILSRAEGYRDQQNFEAAKLEYQSIRDNPAYHATKYGKKAMFRSVDLQIESGNAQGVESTLEYWLSQNDREIQAEAHYFLAKLAFNRKDYDECIKQLRLVFGIDFTHTEARFLQGKWKLATNSEVDDTEVLVGRLGDRNMIKPGNQFTITVQDANLSVAGGGASIPVVVTTKPGGDAERVSLYPTSRDPSTFKGLVEVVLGKANPSNRVLEVRGDDIVSYVIEPAFLKERGLPLNEPKRLSVIDDAKVVIGAGAPRTEEKKAEAGIANLLDDDAQSADSGVSRLLRPGNPLYVVVKDRDCSLGGESDTVRVTVETSSGDRLEDYELKEEKPFTGVFRGRIETSLPPPRAFASDTAAGMNAGDVINSGKTSGWKSLSDGQPGKWFEVDTMGSFLFSEITLDTASVGDIKSIKLVGQMGTKVLSLGQLPAAAELSKLYLRRQQQYDRSPRRSLAQLRAFCQTDKAAKSYIVTNVAFRVLQNHDRWEGQTAFYSGPVAIPEGVDALRFRIVPKSTKKDALRGLWLALAVDGEEIFSGQGAKLQGALVASDITPGCHQFELAVAAGTHDDDFNLMWEPAGKDPSEISADWFDPDKNPQLKGFVKDLAQIVKTANGFKAVFDKPVRLRSFRWEFADVKSPEVSVSRISAKNDHDEAILPVASDFSDAQGNKTLEVAPGDKIRVTFEDERTTSGEKKVLQREMSSSFNDAHVRFIFEEVDERGRVNAYDAFRFQPGDSLVLAVTDPDCDTTDEADKVKVTIKNSSGETVERELVEFAPRWAPGGADTTYGMHSGIFMGILKTCREDNTNAPPKTLRVKSDDLLTVTYDDRENTNPGVPFERTARIFAARKAEPKLTLFDVRKSQIVDTSADAKVKLERIRRRPGNENVQVVYRDVLAAEPMSDAVLDSTNPIPVNVSAGAIPIRVNDRSRARYSGSKIMVEAVAHSEIEKAAAEGRDPVKVKVPLRLAGSLSPFRLVRGDESAKEAQSAGTFNGVIRLSLGPLDPNIEVPEDAPPVLCVTGSDLIDVAVLSEDGEPVFQRTLKLVSDATLGLSDSSFSAERTSAHVGESFFVMVDDADRDATEEPDRIEAEVVSSKTGIRRPIVLSETMPHSGIFTGRLRPVMFAPGETIPSVATGGVASANEVLTEERLAVGYGDSVIFRYRDEQTLPWTPARTLAVTGSVFRGSNGGVRLFSKRFADRDTAVLVQFRLAECLFEQAKEHRKLKQPEKSAQAIAEGKFILEEALKNYPDSSHVVQGEYLLANLYQELATEQKDAGEKEKAIPLYQEALSRFSQILGTWPEGEYAARSQYHKALCLEMLEDYGRASEEYVKMTYLYPESELVGEATIRLATYYYTKEKRYDVSGHIYRNFQQRFPHHEKAPRALFMAGSCYIKQAETITEQIAKCRAEKRKEPVGAANRVTACYKDAIKTFETLVETYRDGSPTLRAQALYWAGDICVRCKEYSKAYKNLKRTVFEFPETEWARRARGLLLQESKSFENME